MSMEEKIEQLTRRQLIGRAYQEELAQQARERNVIIAAETGTGKTLVAALVIRWKMSMEAMHSTGVRKVAMFLVPKVPLVEQQRSFLEENTALKCKGYTGQMGVDYWDRTAWKREFNEADVLVMTPQIFLNTLRHAHWSLDQVSIIVFDEIHNCKGRSPEAQIMNDHYHQMKPDERPKILGLTASPIFNMKNPDKALRDIEQLTACKVIKVDKHTEEMAAHTFQARDRIVEYAMTPTIFATYPKPSLWEDLHHHGCIPNETLFPTKKLEKASAVSEWYKAFRARYVSTLSALGPLAADVFVLVHMTSSLEGVKEDIMPLHPRAGETAAKRRAAVEAAFAILEAHQPRLVLGGRGAQA